MQLLLLALTLTTVTFLFGCSPQNSEVQSETPSAEIPQKTTPTPLNAALEDLRVLKIKLEKPGGIILKEYEENINDLENIVSKAKGTPKVLSTVKSALKGHELALQFWQCDRASGYDELYECRDKALKAIFVKYPDIKSQAKAAVTGEKLPFLSSGLDKEGVLQAIWMQTGADTDAAIKATTVPSPQKQP